MWKVLVVTILQYRSVIEILHTISFYLFQKQEKLIFLPKQCSWLKSIRNKLQLWQHITFTDFSIYVNKVVNFFVHTIRYLKQVQSTNKYIQAGILYNYSFRGL